MSAVKNSTTLVPPLPTRLGLRKCEPNDGVGHDKEEMREQTGQGGVQYHVPLSEAADEELGISLDCESAPARREPSLTGLKPAMPGSFKLDEGP